MDVIYRPAGLEDLEPSMRIVQQAFTELRVRNGLGPAPLRPPTFQTFVRAEDPSGVWVAKAEDTIIGFACSWMRQRFWYLSQLFIRPDIQSKGVGQALMSRTLEQAERNGATNLALITTGYNMVSTALYIRNGLFPREPLYRHAVAAMVLEGRLVAEPDYTAAALSPWPAEQAWLDVIDDAVIGFRRDTQHAFQQAVPGMRALLIYRAGHPAGYAYVSVDGHIGPLAVAPNEDPVAVTRAAIRAALDGQPRQISLVVPGRAERILAGLSPLGFRIEESMLLMAAHPFGDWARYLPSNPGFM